MQTVTELAAQGSDALKAAIQAELRAMFTTLPGLISTSDQHIATALSTILALIRNSDGSMTQAAMPPFQTLPVHFAGGGLVVSTHPIKANDEGIILFAARALDSWHQSGGQQAPTDARQHHPSDGFWLGGVKSDPNKIANPAPDSIQHRSLDGKVTHDVDPTNGTTTKVVDPSDSAPNPFASATIYHQTTHNASTGIVKKAIDAMNTHTMQLQRILGLLVSVVTGTTASHTLNLTPTGGFTASASNPAMATSASVNCSPAGVLALAATNGITAPAGSISGSALTDASVTAAKLTSGAAASNVGALGGVLTGRLPNPTYNGSYAGWLSVGFGGYSNNAAARAGGVPAGGLYLNLSILSGEYILCVAH